MSARAALVLAAALAAGGAAWWMIARERRAVAVPEYYEGGGWVTDAGDVVTDWGAPSLADEVQAAASSAWDAVADVLDGAMLAVGVNVSSRWLEVAQRAENAPYYQALLEAEQKYSIPSHMLVRLAYQESRFRPDIISGATVSRAGAVGLMQIVPRWHPTVNALDWSASIDYAGKYLSDLKRQFGNWEHALQAYNWGQGNLRKFLAGQISKMPTETSNYSRMILADIGAASGVFA